LAGHETTATSLAYEITLLAKNPETQDKLRKEILDAIPGEMTKENLVKCEYLNVFIKEAMRLYPAAKFVPTREAIRDCRIGDYNVPAGTHIAVNIYGLQMSEDVYGDPENFRPERWLPSEQAKKKIPSTAWIPFSSGSRVCIGNNFSLYEQRVFLVELLKNYKITTKDLGPVLAQRGMILTPPQKCELEFIKIK
jgi:cytochrome P450